MAGFAAELLEGATLTVETALSPAVTIKLAPDDSPPGVLSQFLRPRYTVAANNVVLLVREPAGRLEETRGAVLLAVGVLLLLVFVVWS